MAINDDLAEIKAVLYTVARGLEEGVVEIKDANNKLRYDIEPKLDKALEGKTASAEEKKPSPDEIIRNLKYYILYAATNRKIEAIKALREATGVGLREAKEAVEWIEGRLAVVREAAVNDYKDNQAKEAE